MKKEGEEGKKLSRWRVGEEEGSRIGDREKMGLSRRLHSSLHFSAASENNASPTQSGKHYSLLLRPFSTDSRSQFCNDPSRRATLSFLFPSSTTAHVHVEPYDFVPPFHFFAHLSIPSNSFINSYSKIVTIVFCQQRNFDRSKLKFEKFTNFKLEFENLSPRISIHPFVK